MHLSLDTLSLWNIPAAEHPAGFFRALGAVLDPSDILVVGSYGMKVSAERFLECICLEVQEKVPYGHTFEVNRDEHPSGRAWHFLPTPKVLGQLADLSLQDAGKRATHFFDHVVAYRPGRPIVPLLCFHDALTGGDLQLSGLYAEEDVAAFCEILKVPYARIDNPVVA